MDQIVDLNPTPTWSEASVDTENYKVNSLVRVKDLTTALTGPFYIPSSKFGRSCMGSMVGYKRNDEEKCMTKNTNANCSKMGRQFYSNLEFDNSGGSTFIPPTISCIDSTGATKACADSGMVLIFREFLKLRCVGFFFWSSFNQFKAFAGSTCSNAVTAAIIQIEEANSSTPGYIGKVDIILTLEDKNTAWIERETKV